MQPKEPGAHDSGRRWLLLVVAVLLCVGLVGSIAGWLLWPQPSPPAHLAIAPAPPAPVVAPAFPIESASEQAIRDHTASELTVFRLADNPQILVLDFASLHDQGMMLNRVAAFVEKAGLPHDRVLTDDELDAAIRTRGDTVETFYFGHDYSAGAIALFFTTADSQHIELDAQEEKLRALMRQEGWLVPGVNAGLISVPAVGSDARVTAVARATILRHELSHGEFFSNPDYAEYARSFWRTVLSENERTGIRRFLARDEYDDRLEELMLNEMQAYLMFTRDPAFFTPDMVGMPTARLAELQSRFLTGMPAGWLRDVLASYPSATGVRP